MKTLDEFLKHYASTTPDATAVIDYRQQRSFAELHESAEHVAQALHRSGVKPGDRVAVLDQNSVEIIELLFACARVGAMLVPLNFRLNPQELSELLISATPRLTVVHPSFEEDLKAAVELAGSDLEIVVIDGTDHQAYDTWIAAAADTQFQQVSPYAEPVCLVYTSGSTGTPKGVVLNQEGFAMYHPDTIIEWEMDEDTVTIVALPLFHIGALSWFAGSLVNGTTAVILRFADPAVILDAIEAHKGTHINVVPAVLQMMLREQHDNPRDVSSFKVVTAGGSPVPTAYLREALDVFGCSVFAFYGLSEAAGGVAHAKMKTSYIGTELESRLRSAGRPMPGVELSIRDIATGDEMPEGEAGEIVLRSPGVMLEYWKNPDATENAFTADGWLRTGDVGRIDESGYLYILDRLKDIIISGGENIYASELEDVISSCPGVLEVSVVAAPHEHWGETPKAYVVQGPGPQVTEQSIIDFTRQRIARYKCPTIVEIVDQLPKTASGKIDKVKLNRMLKDTEQQPTLT